jgi:hypothetical protein
MLALLRGIGPGQFFPLGLGALLAHGQDGGLLVLGEHDRFFFPFFILEIRICPDAALERGLAGVPTGRGSFLFSLPRR